ncbi:MAG: type IV secretory system conjugative DNA transfer family protein [Ruminococcus sp.]
MNTTAIVIFTVIIVGLVCIPAILAGRGGNLNKIKATKTGDGQYGTAEWANKSEITDNFKIIDFEPDKWRQGIDLPTVQGIILGTEQHGKRVKVLVDDSESNTLFDTAPGGGKTTTLLYPNLEYAAAVGMSCFVTDTKGNVYRDYAPIIQKYYGYSPYVIDLRYPMSSNSYNFLCLVNKYMNSYLSSGDLSDKARAESYAKGIGNTIIHMDGLVNAGQNTFFYTTAEGVIAAITLLVAELCENSEKHIVSVFKLIRQLLEVDPETVGKKEVVPTLYLSKLYALLPEDHIAKDLLAPTVTNEFKTVASIMTTAMSQMLRFIDSEIEQIICFDDGFSIDSFVNQKTMVFFVVDEKSNTRNFMLNLILRQMYNELLRAAEFEPNISLPKRVYMYLDEFGTYGSIDDVQKIFSAGRSRNIMTCPFLQSLAQLNKNYNRDVAQIIKNCCQNVMFSFQAPLSDDAETFSKMLGTQTVQAGSVSHRSGYNNSSSQTSINMVKMPLMTADQITNLKKGEWVLKKTGMNPLQIKLPKLEKYGIKIDSVSPYKIKNKNVRTVNYADRNSLINAVMNKYHNSNASYTDTSKQSVSTEYLS